MSGGPYGPKGEPPLVFIMVFILVFICQPFRRVLYNIITGPEEFCQILRGEGMGVPKVYNRRDPRGSTPVLFVEFRSFSSHFGFFPHIFLTFTHFLSNLRTFLSNLQTFLSNLQTFLSNLLTFLLNFVATDVYALSIKFLKSLPAVFFPFLV